MRIRILSALFAILLVIGLSLTGSCKKNSTEPEPFVDEALRPFAGTWNVLSYIYTNSTDTLDIITAMAAEITIKVELSRDLTIISKVQNLPAQTTCGTIKVKDDDELILNIQGKTAADTVSFTFSQDSTNLTYVDNNELINFSNPTDITPGNLVAAKLTVTLTK